MVSDCSPCIQLQHHNGGAIKGEACAFLLSMWPCEDACITCTYIHCPDLHHMATSSYKECWAWMTLLQLTMRSSKNSNTVEGEISVSSSNNLTLVRNLPDLSPLPLCHSVLGCGLSMKSIPYCFHQKSVLLGQPWNRGKASCLCLLFHSC